MIPYAEPFGFAARTVDGNDALDVYHSARWARATALAGQPVFLDCITFRTGLYSSHFGEVRPGIEADLAEAERRDPLKRMARLVDRERIRHRRTIWNGCGARKTRDWKKHSRKFVAEVKQL